MSKFSHRTKGWTLKRRRISITGRAGAPMDLTVSRNAGYSGCVAEARYLETQRKACPNLAHKVRYTQKRESRPPKKEWRPKPTRIDAKTSADAHMVFVLPAEFHVQGREELPVA
jgi:hypothetical protein